jgi:hypothetical protein
MLSLWKDITVGVKGGAIVKHSSKGVFYDNRFFSPPAGTVESVNLNEHSGVCTAVPSFLGTLIASLAEIRCIVYFKYASPETEGWYYLCRRYV